MASNNGRTRPRAGKIPKRRKTGPTMTEMIHALSHQTRVDILEKLIESGEPQSPSDLAEALGQRLGNVSYHIRCLHASAVLTEVKRVPRRGAIEHFYKIRDERTERIFAELFEATGVAA